MPDKDLEHIERVFHAVLELAPADRETYLQQACSGDKQLYAEVTSLISALASDDGFIEEPTLNLGMRVLSQSSEQSMNGKTIGPFNVISRLGKGGMGEVYLADDHRLGRKVALKFLSQEFVGDNWAKRQLVKEAQSVAMLDHPNICAVYGIEEIDGHIFIVMQYVEGETLAALIRNSPIDATQVVPLGQQIVGALAEAHAHGIIHRDIKPKNIMVTPAGKIKVLDFGLAKTIQRLPGALEPSEDSTSQLSQIGLLPGTIAYMSPEQLRGERLDYRSDVFSVGIVLREMIGETNPFLRDTPAETISAILSSAPTPLRQPTKQTPKELDRVVSKCLAKTREARYQSASDLLIDLNLIAGGPGIKRSFTTRTAVTLAFVLLLAFVVTFIYFQVTRPKMVAVLPIENTTGDANLDYISGGFSDSISTKLSGLSRLRVKPASTLTGYRQGNADPRQIGKELGVDGIIKGTLSRNNQSVVLQVALYSAADGAKLWEGEYQVDQPQSVFFTESDIARRVTANMEFRSQADEQKTTIALGPQNPEARREYWLGTYYLKNRGNSKSTLDDAIKHFNAAIELEPTYAAAYAGLSDCYASWNVVAYGQADTQEAMSKAVRAANDALNFDDRLPNAHTSLATVNMKYYWDWNEAEREFKKAIELDSEYAPAHYGYSAFLTIRGRNAEAIGEAQISLGLDPFSPAVNLNYCRALFFARRFEDAGTCLDKLVNDFSAYETGRYVRGWFYLHAGRYSEAIATFADIYSRDKRLGGAALGYTYGILGKHVEATKILSEMLGMSKESNLPPQEIALIYYGLGDMDHALEWFEKCAATHFAPFAFLAVDPSFDRLRMDERFMKLFKEHDVPFSHPSRR